MNPTFEMQLPMLVIVVPLLGALFTMFFGPGRLAWTWTMLVNLVTFALTIMLLGEVQAAPDGIVEYAMGRWRPEYGIGYKVDRLNAMVLLIVSGIGAVTTFYARRSVAQEIADDRTHIFYTIWTLALVGMLGMAITGDAFNVYVMLEISALTVYTLIAMGKDMDRRALLAALRYLVIGSIGATFILLGIGYLLMTTGTLNMEDMHNQLMAMPDIERNRTVLVSFAFLVTGMAVKMALFPLHMWLPNAYTYAPSAVSAMLAATATKVGVYIGLRFLFTVYGPDFSFFTIPTGHLLIAAAAGGVIACSAVAIRQTNVKRLLAYSSVAQIGYMVMGFALNNHNGIAGSVVHLFNHALIKGGMFLALGAVVYRLGAARLVDLSGLGRRMPWTMAAFTLGGFGLIGFPLTAGFISKWYLVQGAIDAGMWWLVVVILIGSLLAVIYVWRVVEVIYFGEPAQPERLKDVKEAPVSMVISIWLLVGGSLYFGVDATFSAGWAEAAAEQLVIEGPGSGGQP